MLPSTPDTGGDTKGDEDDAATWSNIISSLPVSHHHSLHQLEVPLIAQLLPHMTLMATSTDESSRVQGDRVVDELMTGTCPLWALSSTKSTRWRWRSGG